MKNQLVANHFILGGTATGSNFCTTGEKLFSYETTIAEWFNGKLLINPTKYSSSTSHHQTLLRKAIIDYDISEEVCVYTQTNVPINTSSLKDYV